MRCDTIRFVHLFVYYNIYLYICRIKFVRLRIVTLYLNSNSRQNLNFARSQGGAGARTALLVGGVAEAAPPIPALYSGVLNRFKRDGRERVARAG